MFCIFVVPKYAILMTRRGHYTHTKEILKIGLPIMLGQLGVILVGFIDNIMVGHHSTMELGAASFVNNFMNLAFIFGLGFSYGLTPLISAAFAGRSDRLHHLLSNSLLANGLVGLLLTIIMAIIGFNLDRLNQPAELTEHIRPYYAIQACSIIIVMLFNAYKQYADGTDRAIIAMKVMLLSNVINVILNYFLIFGKSGFPELGLIGAGLATLVARIFCLVAMVWILSRKGEGRQRYNPFDREYAKYNKQAFVHLFKLGTPVALQMGVETASFSLAVIMVGWIGSIELAAHQIVAVISTLGFMFFYGLSSAVTIKMSRYYEVGDVGKMRATVTSGLALQLLMATGLVVILLLTRHLIGRIFTEDEQLISIVATLCIPVMAYQFGDVLQILFANALRGLRDVTFTAVSAIICHIPLALGLVYLFAFPLGLGLIGVWMAFPVSLTTLGVLLLFRYRHVMRRLECSPIKAG